MHAIVIRWLRIGENTDFPVDNNIDIDIEITTLFVRFHLYNLVILCRC